MGDVSARFTCAVYQLWLGGWCDSVGDLGGVLNRVPLVIMEEIPWC